MITLFLQSEAGKIQVYVRVRPFTEREKEKRETNAIEIHQEHSLVRNLTRQVRNSYMSSAYFCHGQMLELELDSVRALLFCYLRHQIRVLDPRSRTNYFFDGVFSPEASNQEVRNTAKAVKTKMVMKIFCN